MSTITITPQKTTVKEILDDIQVRLPHAYTDDNLISWINDTIKKIYKDLTIQEQYSFVTNIGQELYMLPSNCTIDMITGVTISTKALTGKDLEDWGSFKELKSYLPNEKMREPGYYDGRTDKTTINEEEKNITRIGIYPLPQESRKVNVYYMKRPTKITSVDDIIEIDDNFTDLIKYNVMSIICLSGYNPDIELANEYILLYNNLVQKANESKNEKQQRYPVIRNLFSKRRRR